MKKKRPHFKNTGTGEYDIESLSSYGGLEVEDEEDLDDEEEEDEKMLEDLEEKQLMGRIEGLEGSKSYEKNTSTAAAAKESIHSLLYFHYYG